MKHPSDISKHWLVAEQDGREIAAERALRALFLRLPEASPAVDFADRVMASVAVGRPARLASYPLWSRAAIAASLLVVGLTAAFVLPAAVSLARVIAPAEAIGSLVQGFVALAGRLDELLSLWQIWAQVVDVALLIATAPPVMLALLTLTALSAFTFRGLKQALVPHRSQDHVPA